AGSERSSAPCSPEHAPTRTVSNPATPTALIRICIIVEFLLIPPGAACDLPRTASVPGLVDLTGNFQLVNTRPRQAATSKVLTRSGVSGRPIATARTDDDQRNRRR